MTGAVPTGLRAAQRRIIARPPKNRFLSATSPAWGKARDDIKRGRWTARGTREQGVILLTPEGGKSSTVAYRVHVERRQVFWREYFFDGELYQEQR